MISSYSNKIPKEKTLYFIVFHTKMCKNFRFTRYKI